MMDTSWISLSHDELLVELDTTERAIARSRTFTMATDTSGRTRAQVSPELLALAEREHEIVRELRRRIPTTSVAA